MNPTIPRTKPKIGVLMYGNKQVCEPDTFRNLGNKQAELIRQGFDKAKFHKHYYYGRKN